MPIILAEGDDVPPARHRADLAPAVTYFFPEGLPDEMGYQIEQTADGRVFVSTRLPSGDAAGAKVPYRGFAEALATVASLILVRGLAARWHIYHNRWG